MNTQTLTQSELEARLESHEAWYKSTLQGRASRGEELVVLDTVIVSEQRLRDRSKITLYSV